MTIEAFLAVAPDVGAAVAEGRPVVALESTLITHGLPFPQNLEVALASETAVREAGAAPATIAVIGGRIRVGLEEAELRSLAESRGLRKAARHTLAAALASGEPAGTTVSATMIAAAGTGIRVFATGGIGGVHLGALGTPGSLGTPGAPGTPGAGPTLDISSDLDELARTPVAVVCAGPKSILDVPLTLEYLETRGVPVLTLGAAEVPGFYSRSSGVRSPLIAPDMSAAAGVVRTHLAMGLGSGVLVCVPIPNGDAVPGDQIAEAVRRATAEAEREGIRAGELTPWLLARLAELTDGATVRANVALIVNNARAAAGLAIRLAR